jgi:hypothetical protein
MARNRKGWKLGALGCGGIVGALAAGSVAANLVARQLPPEGVPIPARRLVALGTVNCDGQKRTVYCLPDSERRSNNTYEQDNASLDNDSLDDRATRLFVDHDGDGLLTPIEGRPANLGLRLGDTMFKVKGVSDKDAPKLERDTKGPLRGIVVGRKCPDFEYTCLDGQKRRRDDYRGRWLMVQVWSHRSDWSATHATNLAVAHRDPTFAILTLSVDRSYGDDEAAVRKALANEHIDWPVALVPDGWNGLARTWNLTHFGVTVIDPAGIVRGAELNVDQAVKLMEQ